MLMTTISATTARANLYDLIDEVAKTGKRVGITKKGETKVILMSVEELESWEETNEILSDKKLMKDIRVAEKELAEGKGKSWEEVKKELGWDV
jgi:antitoxin YefM